jgi:arsenate reductase-like glutaredoxin family protein
MNLPSEERFIMEKVTVNIETIADAMEATMDGWEQYLNMETGEIVSLSDGTWSDRDEEDEALAEEIDTTDKYVRIPNQYEIHEYEIMEEFAYATPNPRYQEKLLRVLRGRKPYRNFKDEINCLGISESYYAWRLITLCKKAKIWCEENEVPYEIITEGLNI